MVEIIITALNIQNENFSIEKAIDFFKIVEPKDIKRYVENPQALLYRAPNQILTLIFKRSPQLDLEKKDYEELIEIAFDEIGLKGQFEDSDWIIFSKPISPSKIEYKVYLRTEEEFKDYNINKRNNFKELILLQGFEASTNYGKVLYADISKQVLNFTPKEMDLRIITKSLENNNVIYFCFSKRISSKFTENLIEDEYRFVQIDISDYVEELEKIAKSQLFMKICPAQYPSEIIQELGNMRTQNYRGVAKLWTAIESTLGNISQNLGCTGNTIGPYLDYLSSRNSHRRLAEETKNLIIAMGRNNQAHGRLLRSDTDQRYFALLSMKTIRDVYYDWCFFQSLDICFPQIASYLNLHIDEIWKIYYDKKFIVTNSENWGLVNDIVILFEDVNSKKVKFKFIIKLRDNCVISSATEVLQ